MKKNLCLLLVCLLSAAAPLQAQDMQQAQKLIDQAQKYLYNNPKQASYYAAQASALFPEDEPSDLVKLKVDLFLLRLTMLLVPLICCR